MSHKSIRGCVLRSVGPSVDPAVRLSVIVRGLNAKIGLSASNLEKSMTFCIQAYLCMGNTVGYGALMDFSYFTVYLYINAYEY